MPQISPVVSNAIGRLWGRVIFCDTSDNFIYYFVIILLGLKLNMAKNQLVLNTCAFVISTICVFFVKLKHRGYSDGMIDHVATRSRNIFVIINYEKPR